MNNTEKKSGQKLWKALTSVLLLAILGIAGFFAIASEYGTSEDPLVSLSYINNVLAPQISEKVDAIIAEKTNGIVAEIDSKVNTLSNELDDKVAAYAADNSDVFTSEAFISQVADKVAAKVGTSAGASSTFVRVDLTAGQTLNLSIGTEVLLRLGSATCVAKSNPGLIDMSDSTDLANGKALVKNHLYLCTVDGGRAVKASGNATVFVRGSYTIS